MKHMAPIANDLKSKRIKWDKDTPALEWAFTKAFREYNTTKQILPENPYCEVYTVRENMYAIFSENADGHTDVWSYLVIGPEKAMLIDNGFGIGDWKALCDTLAGGKEIIVANTHASYDHSYGNSWFDKAYMHKYSVPPCEALKNPHIWDYLFDDEGNNIWLDFDKADLPLDNYDYEIVGVEDHHIFDLGEGYEVELIWMPGHMAGHCFFLDKHNKILFTGDGLESGASAIAAVIKDIDTYSKYFCNVESMYQQFKLLVEERMDEIDHIFPGHGIIDVESRVLPEVLKALEHIVTDPEHPTRLVEKVKKNGKKDVRCYQLVPEFTELVYFPGSVKPMEEFPG